MNYKIWLNAVKLSNKYKLELASYFKSEEEIFNYAFGIKRIHIKEEEKIKFYLKKAWDAEQYNKVSKKLSNSKVHICSIYDKEYPKTLLNYEDAPAVLYYLGDIKKLNENITVAIIGSRRNTYYGKNVATIISEALSQNNINVVSGLARGIDGIAHETAINNNGFTAGILGSGIDVIYPKDNSAIFKKMSTEGVIISEFPPGTPPFAYNFPIRNRIISALSSLIIVVEAGEKSGSLITATLALEQGKDVMAVPGSILENESKGSNKLIKEGAYVFTKIDDIFDVLGVTRIQCQKSQFSKMNDMETKVYNSINFNPIHIDEIFKVTHIDIKQIYKVLFELQLKNKILCIPGNFYARIIKGA